MKPGQKLESLLKSDFGKFFIVKVEDMIRLIKLPVPPTRGTTHTFIYLTYGEAIMTIGSETYKIIKDECLIVPAGQVFSFENVDVNKGYLCNFHNDILIGRFGKSHLPEDFEFLSVWGNPRIQMGHKTSKYIQHLLKRIFLEYSQYGLKNSDLIQAYFIAMLCEIGSIYKPLSNSGQSRAVKLTNRFKELLFLHVRTKHLVTEYASILHVTRNHLNKSVKTITGKSPAKWIGEALVLEAKVLLHQTDLPINEIASEIGIYDQSYFSRLFKKHEGVTPAAFRKGIERS